MQACCWFRAAAASSLLAAARGFELGMLARQTRFAMASANWRIFLNSP